MAYISLEQISGDVTISNGVSTIGVNKVTLAQMATIANNTVLGNISGGSAVPSALTVGNVQTLLGLGSAAYTASTAYISSTSTQTANTLFSGPASGAAAAPTFRAMVNSDIPTTLTPQFARVGIGAAADASALLNVAAGCSIFGGAAYDSTRSLVINGNVRVSDQSNIVAVTGVNGSVSTNRVMFHAENVTPWTPTLSTDTALYGMWSAPNVAPTATTFSMTATGLYGVPVVSSSAVGARLSITGTNTGAYRTSSNDLSSYASNSLVGIRNAAGNYLGPPGTIITGAAYALLNYVYNFNGTITTAYGYYGSVSVGNVSGSANPVIGTYYAIRLAASLFANGGSITTEWGISQESTTAKNYFAGNVGIGTTAPGFPLDVVGQARIGANMLGYGTLSVERYASAPYATLTLGDQATPANTVGIYLRQNGTNPAGISTDGAPLAFYVGGPATTEAMRILANGNVGIGTTTMLSGALLTVNGAIGTSAPTGGTAAAWKMGSVVTGIAATLITTSYLQVDVGGTLYKLALVTSVP